MNEAKKEKSELYKTRKLAYEEKQRQEEEGDDGENAAEGEEGAEPSIVKEPEDEKDTLMNQLEREAIDFLEEQIGRYVPGYRHYESYQNYAVKYPERTLVDYINDMNREVT